VKLNDPFGRVARRDQGQYATFKQQLRQAHVTTADGVRTFAHNASTTMLRLVVVTAGGTTLMGLLFPAARGLAAAVAALVLIWLAASYVKTRLYLARYLREECDNG